MPGQKPYLRQSAQLGIDHQEGRISQQTSLMKVFNRIDCLSIQLQNGNKIEFIWVAC